MSIWTANKLRLSSMSMSNDSLEGRWFFERFREKLTSIENGLLLKGKTDVFSLFDKVFSRSGLDLLSMCFSEERDLLSQWRGYASDAEGICIGFSTQKLSELEYCDNGSPIALSKVIYDKDQQDTIISEMLDEHLDISNVDDIIMHRGLVERIVTNTFMYKNPAFHEEREWRLSSGATNDDYDPSSMLLHVKHNKFVPYREVSLPKDRSTISEVILGPKNKTPEKILEQFVRGHDILVSRSNASLR
ncbi:hypothetical protein GCM10008927_15110 [Amylibacter ulvae]|uniref:DUF2971 domain-containing protein n=1 Tax=Paramylibacter ulvae TaxID=1651968 RepID=A0ABQ3D0J4_9RHOB|nr:DUF2971 domain-containing protein [Amylibacter ulvae]GHA50837.1 hypothetical protein GCM10008927_15110 [Amylibacter ulvae]